MKRFKPLSIAIGIVVVAAAILFHLPASFWFIIAGGYFVKYVVEGYRGKEEN